MPYIAILLLIAGGTLLYAGRRGYSPSEVLRAVLQGSEMPAEKYKIESQSLGMAGAAGVGADWVPQAGGGGAFGGTFARPLSSWKVTSGFGMRWGRMHLGVDVPASTGTPIKASAAGTVDAAGWAGGAGNRVNIKHNSTHETRYFHMSRIAVSRGQRVSQGQTIGYVGSTGDSSGPHLHFEVWQNGSAKDPMGYVR